MPRRLLRAVVIPCALLLLAASSGVVGAVGASLVASGATAGGATPKFTLTCTGIPVFTILSLTVEVTGTLTPSPVTPGRAVSAATLLLSTHVSKTLAGYVAGGKLGVMLVETAIVTGATTSAGTLTFEQTITVPAKTAIPSTGLAVTAPGTLRPATLTASSAGVVSLGLGTTAKITITLNGSAVGPFTCTQPSETIATATIAGPLVIVTTSLPSGTVTQAYTATLSGGGGSKPRTWSAVGLPGGLQLDSTTGVISGTPTAAGTTTVMVTLDGGTGAQTSRTLALAVSPMAPLSITTVSLPPGTVAKGYADTLAATGGKTPYSWAGTGLPSGLSLDPATGTISGTPTTPGTSSVEVTVTDAQTPPVRQTATFELDVAPASATAATPAGYWEVASDGGVFAFGSARFYGSMGGKLLDAPVVGIAPAPTGAGYWEVAADGGVFAFGSAAFYGSMSGKPLDAPVVGIAPTPTGAGYWEVAADGGVFAFGSAAFSGSMGGKTLDAPVEGIAASATPAGSGYWEAAADGGVFAFGSAAFSGSMSGSPLDAPVVGVATASPVPLDETPIGDIAHSGRWLTDASGRVVLLHGVNVVAKTVPYYPSAAGFDAADAAWLEENGLRVVRLGVMATGLMPTPGKITQGYIADLAATVRTLEAHHIYVLLDMHQDGYGPKVGSDGFPAWMTLTEGKPNTNDRFPTYYYEDPATQQAFQSLWDNAKGPNGVGLQTDVADMFGALAQAFHSTQNVLGYDVFNEPWPGTTWESCGAGPAGCPNLDSSELDPLYAKVDRAIRSVTRSHTVFVEPFVLFNDGNVQTTVALPGGDPDSGLSFHQYATTAPKATHALDVLKNAITWSSKTGGALLNTEWGDTTTSASITTQADQFDQEMLPWIFWSYCCEVVRTLGSPPAGSNLITSTADALVRPYPLVVAGTPTSYGYEATDRTFTASWSTTEPDGRRAPAGAISTMVVPQRDYPGGYTVNVTGGQVTSKPCATVLAISTEAGTSSARVTVTPGAC